MPIEQLPSWAHAGVTLGDVGITIVHRRRGSLVPWASVLGVVIPGGKKGYILAPRRSPHPPWFIIDNAMLQGDLADEGIIGIKRRFEERASQVVDYRHGRTARRPHLSLEELTARASRREPIPGALNVPIAANAPSVTTRIVVGTAASGSLAYAGSYGALILGAIAQLPTDLGVAFALGSGLVGAIGGVGVGAFHRRPKPPDQRPRVLLLAPDGCLCAFESGARALPWSEVTEFALGVSPRDPNLLALHVIGPVGSHGAIDLHWFDVPSEVVQEIAEAYRANYTS